MSKPKERSIICFRFTGTCVLYFPELNFYWRPRAAASGIASASNSSGARGSPSAVATWSQLDAIGPARTVCARTRRARHVHDSTSTRHRNERKTLFRVTTVRNHFICSHELARHLKELDLNFEPVQYEARALRVK